MERVADAGTALRGVFWIRIRVFGDTSSGADGQKVQRAPAKRSPQPRFVCTAEIDPAPASGPQDGIVFVALYARRARRL